MRADPFTVYLVNDSRGWESGSYICEVDFFVASCGGTRFIEKQTESLYIAHLRYVAS